MIQRLTHKDSLFNFWIYQCFEQISLVINSWPNSYKQELDHFLNKSVQID